MSRNTHYSRGIWAATTGGMSGSIEGCKRAMAEGNLPQSVLGLITTPFAAVAGAARGMASAVKKMWSRKVIEIDKRNLRELLVTLNETEETCKNGNLRIHIEAGEELQPRFFSDQIASGNNTYLCVSKDVKFIVSINDVSLLVTVGKSSVELKGFGQDNKVIRPMGALCFQRAHDTLLIFQPIGDDDYLSGEDGDGIIFRSDSEINYLTQYARENLNDPELNRNFRDLIEADPIPLGNNEDEVEAFSGERSDRTADGLNAQVMYAVHQPSQEEVPPDADFIVNLCQDSVMFLVFNSKDIFMQAAGHGGKVGGEHGSSFTFSSNAIKHGGQVGKGVALGSY